MLTLINVTKIYGEGPHQVVALKNVTVNIEPGEFIAVTGPSGCGKSTLLHLACGLDLPTEGEVIVDGRSTALMMCTPANTATPRQTRKAAPSASPRIMGVFPFHSLLRASAARSTAG